METNSVLLRPENEIVVDDMFLRETDAGILSAAQRYIELQTKSSELLANAEERLLSGTPGTVYLKKLGHRPLSSTDFENIVNAHGTPEDKQTLIDFGAAQHALQERLRTTKAIGLVLEQADIARDLFYKRTKRPDLWKPDEVIRVMNVLDRIQV
jgi:hypothetical protein